MKRLLTTLMLLMLIAMAYGQGIPFIRNFTADEYGANNTNYDIETDENGNVFVANFEGLLYYDYAEWRLIHTPGITRITVVYRAKDNTIWVGGYNYFGKVVRKDNGDIALKRIGDKGFFRGEVTEIYEYEGEIQFVADDATIYKVENDKLTVKKTVAKEAVRIGMLDVVNVEALERGEKDVAKNDTVITLPLGYGLEAHVMKNAGIAVTDKGRLLYMLTDANGLCSNNVAYAAYDGRGHLWGATGRGIFVIHLPTGVSRFTPQEGLSSAVLTIESLNGIIYAGTDDGLFRQEGRQFVRVPEVRHACWELKKSNNSLLAASADGVFRILPGGHARQLTSSHTTSLLEDGSQIYCGELTGLYVIQSNGNDRKKVLNLNNLRKIVKDKDGTIWMQNLFGSIWYKKADSSTFEQYKGKEENFQTIVMTDGQATIVSAEDTKPFPYPLVSYVDQNGVTWMTNNEGKMLYRWKNGKRLEDMDRLLFYINNMPIQAIYTQQNEIWMGNDQGLTVIDTKAQDPTIVVKPKLYIRTVRLGSDSILWGGFGDMPEELPTLNHDENDLTFTYSIDSPSFSTSTVYRYRLNNGSWSSWSPNTKAVFPNLSPGRYTFYVQAHDALNNLTGVLSIKFYIKPPFYLRWYMNLLYLLLLGTLIYFFFRFRVRRLEKEKVRLENVVQERSAEVVRLEKMATAGKLTQGLIDRILNPLNYINNFTKLSEGLVKDAKANVEDEKEHMDEDNYEDTMEVFDMLSVNLKKVGEHGQNTTRMLKAMEEMLRDRSGGIVAMDLMPVIHHDKEMLLEYYKQEIEQYGIKTIVDDSEEPLPINGNADQLSKAIMSLLANAVYAVVKKARKQTDEGEGRRYVPEIALQVGRQQKAVDIIIRDNGIGIGSNILDKIFDPFFTTKTTSEAAGIGLYLSREIIQNHGGDIQVDSVKGEYSEFTITLPIRKS